MLRIREGHRGQHGVAPGLWPSLAKGLRPLVAAAKDLLFPPACLGCGADLPAGTEILFCANCRAKLTLLTDPVCTCCGRPFRSAAGAGHFCGPCLTGRFRFSRARAVLLYEPPLADALHAFKYGGRTVGLRTFRALKQTLPQLDELAAADCIVPVPLHPSRLQARGFNQALLLARAFFPAQRHKIELDALARTRTTAPQTGLSGSERRRNLKGAFAVAEPARIKEKRILLVDDVFTTGTTVNECARTLRKAGAADVQVLTLARVEE